MKATTKSGKRDATIINLVVKLRDEQSLSWTSIRGRLADRKVPVVISGSTVRGIYDEGKGYKGAYYDSRPLVGGRYRQVKTEGTQPEATPEPKTKVAAKRALAKATRKSTATKATKATPVSKADKPATEQAS